MNVSPALTSYSPQFIRVATQVRALGMTGKKVTLFAPVGSVAGIDGFVQSVAEALAALDRAPVLIINVKEVPSDASATLPPSETEVPANGQSYLANLPDQELTPSEQPVSQINALTSRSVDTLPMIVSRARTRMGYVFVDAPTVVDSAATSLAAAYVDAVVLIVQKGISLQRDIEAAKQQFRALGAQIVGFVFIE